MINLKIRLIPRLKSFYLLNKVKEDSNLKIQFGSGNNHIPGWINTDILGSIETFLEEPDIFVDVTKKLPFKDNSVRFSYCEHLVEHLTVKQNLGFFKEVRRILEPNGVFRVATPDLRFLVNKYASPDWKKQDWLHWEEYRFIKSPAEMLNIAMRWWGHKYLFDKEELGRRLGEAGFKKTDVVEWGESKCKELCGLETREDSKLIMEATK